MDMPAHCRRVLVTGCTGHLGSWLVLRLLEKGYSVRASVIDPEDKQDLYPLLGLSPSLTNRLEIVKADLRVEGDYDSVVQGCEGVFHLACPTNFVVDNPQKDAIEPAVQGTLNVLSACIKSSSVKRIIHVSSAVAIRFSGKEEVPEQVFDESCWTDVDFCVENKPPGWPYFVSKTLAERAAVEFAKKHNLDLVVANPVIVNGPFLLPTIPNSVKDCLALITGELFKLPFLLRMSYVHTEDIVRAFIFLYENPEARGRYICSAVDASISEVVNILCSRHPEFQIPTDLAYLGEPVIHYFDASRLRSLGFQFKFSLEEMYDDAIRCCKEKGLLKDVGVQVS